MGLLRRLAPFAFCIAGMFTGHGPVLLSRFALIQNDLGDSRFVNYLFEHSYRWVLRKPHHLSFWDPEFFYPAKNVGAYAESLLGSAPLYWIWRLVGFAPDSAFQIWLLVVSALNFTAMYWLLRRPAKLGVIASCAGAFLFAFAASRINQTQHHQLFPHFFSAIAVGAAWIAVESEDARRARRAIWVFALACALQLYASVYLGWYLGFGLLLTALWALVFRDWRARLFALIRSQWKTVLASGATAAALLSWMLVHYARAASETGGGSDWHEVTTMLPRAQSWVHMGGDSWLYGWTAALSVFKDIPMDNEQKLGVGWATTAMVLVGLALWRRGQRPGLMALVFASTIFLVSMYVADFTPWRGVYEIVPGAHAIRAACRIAIALLIPASLGLAQWMEWLVQRKAWWIALALSAFCVLEQGETTPAYDKAQNRADIATVASLVDPARCDAFLFTPVQGQLQYWKYQLDGVWASLETDVPTLNGYSRTHPPGWDLNEVNITWEGEEETISNGLAKWERERGLDPRRVCWVRRKVRDAPNQADAVSVSVPTVMTAGQTYDAEVVMRNTGESTWTPSAQYRLGVQAPQDTTNWTKLRVDVPGDIPPGQTATFRFQVVAPSGPGRYAFRWRMLRELIAWWGEYTQLVWVDVTPAPPDAGVPTPDAGQ